MKLPSEEEELTQLLVREASLLLIYHTPFLGKTKNHALCPRSLLLEGSWCGSSGLCHILIFF